MKRIILKKISMVNFKKFSNCTMRFNDELTTIFGANGAGKTTLFDAFTWLLFGKSSDDRKQFNIKTLDANNNVIPKLPHSVSAVLSVDGNEIVLTRVLTEKWTKKRGSATEVFEGHEEKRLFNEVPCSVKEWNEKIANICPEATFKLITNPKYFTSQKSDVQRSMLFQLVGGVSDEEVAKDNKEFEDLLKSLKGKTLEDFKKELTAKKKALKSEMDGIPYLLEEKHRELPAEEDWQKLDAASKGAKSKLEMIDKLMMDEGEQIKASIEKKKKKMLELNKLHSKQTEVRSKIENTLLEKYYGKLSQRNELENSLKQLEADTNRIDKDINQLTSEFSENESKMAELRDEWKRINAETISFSEDEFVCPTCKRVLELEDIEGKKAQMTANFNANKASRLAELNEKGKRIKISNNAIQTEINDLVAAKSNNEELYKKTAEELKALGEIEKPETEEMVTTNPEFKKLEEKIKEIEAVIAEDYTSETRKELEISRKEAQDELTDITIRLSKKEAVDGIKKRITELEKQMKEQAVEFAKLEGIEFTIQEFSKKRTEAMEKKVNGLFSLVKFKLNETQINGGEVEVCEAMVEGVPYSDLNNAMKINAGLDIINAISKSVNISAPIFIDNAESVTDLHKTESQIIRLEVSKDYTQIESILNF